MQLFGMITKPITPQFLGMLKFCGLLLLANTEYPPIIRATHLIRVLSLMVTCTKGRWSPSPKSLTRVLLTLGQRHCSGFSALLDIPRLLYWQERERQPLGSGSWRNMECSWADAICIATISREYPIPPKPIAYITCSSRPRPRRSPSASSRHMVSALSVFISKLLHSLGVSNILNAPLYSTKTLLNDNPSSPAYTIPTFMSFSRYSTNPSLYLAT